MAHISGCAADLAAPKNEPPTIADTRREGFTGFFVTCGRADCLHEARFSFDALGLLEETPFPEIAKVRRFRCTRCGSRHVNLMADWREYRAHGRGRPPGIVIAASTQQGAD